MRCAACGVENDPGGRFCESCGSPLTATCPTCGESVKPDARFCRACGTALAPGTPAPGTQPAGSPGSRPDAPVAERRLVTVLFADLVGFTSLAEDRDPESTRELLSAYFDAARDAIERHGGTVEKFIGDAVMAVWGTPVAREDDAERAVRAALELVGQVPALAPELQARAGLLTGEAAVTLGARDQGMVAGDLVNTAARLQGVAEPGTVLVGESTVHLASSAIVFEEVGTHALKGKLTPVPAWRAVRVVAARGGRQRADGLEPPFVGRDEELRLLKEQLHATGRDQRARLVSITGPGGIGKSRLVWELEKYVDGVTEDIFWHRGRSPSYGEGITFWALGEMVRRRAGLTEDDDETTSGEGIRATVEQYVPDTDERALIEPALLTLLGIGDASAGGRDALFPAWRLFFERISEQGLTALVFEDLQWADTGLLDFIDHLLDWSKSRPIFVVTLARPELFDRRPDWGMGRRTLTALALDPLTDEAIRQLLEGVVPGLPETAVATIVSRAEGMPLYAVETVRALLAEGRIERDGDVYRPVGDLATLAIPESLRSLIGSRLDALDAADRALLQGASVLGQVFSPATLAAVIGETEADLEPRLRNLVRRELLEVETDPRSPERGQNKFVQALIREVAYGTLALKDRRNRHLAIARHYEAVGDDELAGALASHYLAAHEASAQGAEADAVAVQARIALRAAAERAVSLGAHAQALAYHERALSITHEPVERAELLEHAGSAAADAGSADAARYCEEAVAAWRDAGDPSGADRATAAYAQVLIDAGDLDEAVALLEPVLADERERDPAAEAALQVAMSRAYMRVGRNAEALECAERGLAIAEPKNLDRLIADGLNARAAIMGRSGRRREAVALQRAARALAVAEGWADLEMRLRNNLAVILFEEDLEASMAELRAAIDTAERVGNAPWYVRSVANWASGRLYQGLDWDEAERLVDDALSRPRGPETVELVAARIQLAAARGRPANELMRELDAAPFDSHQESFREGIRAFVMLGAGDFTAAERHARRAMELDETGEGEQWFSDQLIQIAFATRDLAKATEIARYTRARLSQGDLTRATLALVEGGVAFLEGRLVEARDLLGRAIDHGRSSGLHFATALWELAAVRLAPNLPEASDWAADAREVFTRVGAAPYLAQLDAATASLPESATARSTAPTPTPAV